MFYPIAFNIISDKFKHININKILCLCLCVNVGLFAVEDRCPQRPSGILEVELQVDVSDLTGMLELNMGSLEDQHMLVVTKLSLLSPN